MRALAAVAALVAVAALSSGCTAAEPACTMIGSSSGVGVTVDRAVAPSLKNLSVTVCWDDQCETKPVELQPGSVTVDATCSGSDPEDSCSASSSPDGTLTGFADIADLPAGTVKVSATATVDGRAKKFAALEIAATLTYPNGRQCPAGGTQSQVTIGTDGLR